MIFWLIGLTIAWVFLFAALCFVTYRIHQIKVNKLNCQDLGARTDISDLKLAVKKLDEKESITPDQLQKVVNRYNDKYESQFTGVYHELDKKADKYIFYGDPYKITCDDSLEDEVIASVNQELALKEKWANYFEENRHRA